MSTKHKSLVWLHALPKTPPLSQKARIEAGYAIGGEPVFATKSSDAVNWSSLSRVMNSRRK